MAAYFTVSAPKLITPDVYSFSELMVGTEHRKRPLFIIITIAAKVTDRPQVPQVRSWKGLHLQGGADRTSDPVLTSAVFHAMHVILSLKLGDHEGLALFVLGHLLQRTLLVVLPAILIQIPIHAFLSPVPACCRGQSRTAWCCLTAAGGMPVPGTQLQETQCQFYGFSFISLIFNIISVMSKVVLIFNL